jgi:hypothetical protein
MLHHMKVFFSLATLFLMVTSLRSQETAPSDFPTTAVFLLGISPSPMQNAMGGAGVALPSDDAFNTFFH